MEARDPDRARAEEAPVTYTDHFVFSLCGRAYALPPGSVEQVSPVAPIVPVPTVPSHVRGVVHLRGRIVAVIDLAALIGVDGAGDTSVEPRMVLLGGDLPFAFVADGTLGIWSVAGEPVRSADDGAMVRGRIDGPGAVATLLDPSGILAQLLDARAEAA